MNFCYGFIKLFRTMTSQSMLEWHLVSSPLTRGAFMKNLMHQFSKPGQLVLDDFAGHLSTAKAFLLVENHRQSSGYEQDVLLLENSMPNLEKAQKPQLLHLEYLYTWENSWWGRRQTTWKQWSLERWKGPWAAGGPRELSSTQSF